MALERLLERAGARVPDLDCCLERDLRSRDSASKPIESIFYFKDCRTTLMSRGVWYINGCSMLEFESLLHFKSLKL